MGLFDRFRRRDRKVGPAPSAQTLADLKEFIVSRDGVEGFVEPPTTVYAMSLCLVATDGEYLRRPIKDERQARTLCRSHGIPLYDARIVGYPRRMRDYERGVRRDKVSLDDLPPLDTIEDERED